MKFSIEARQGYLHAALQGRDTAADRDGQQGVNVRAFRDEAAALSWMRGAGAHPTTPASTRYGTTRS